MERKKIKRRLLFGPRRNIMNFTAVEERQIYCLRRVFGIPDMRYTFATPALQNDMDIKTVSSMLSHYDAEFTLRTYTHATRQMQDQAEETMGSFMAQVM